MLRNFDDKICDNINCDYDQIAVSELMEVYTVPSTVLSYFQSTAVLMLVPPCRVLGWKNRPALLSGLT